MSNFLQINIILRVHILRKWPLELFLLVIQAWYVAQTVPTLKPARGKDLRDRRRPHCWYPCPLPTRRSQPALTGPNRVFTHQTLKSQADDWIVRSFEPVCDPSQDWKPAGTEVKRPSGHLGWVWWSRQPTDRQKHRRSSAEQRRLSYWFAHNRSTGLQ